MGRKIRAICWRCDRHGAPLPNTAWLVGPEGKVCIPFPLSPKGGGLGDATWTTSRRGPLGPGEKIVHQNGPQDPSGAVSD